MVSPRTSVFIVEDEALIAMELRDRLAVHGYQVCGHAMRGEAAVAEIVSCRPDVVLMDIHLAGAMDGIETARHLRGQVDAAVIFLTAYSDDELLRKAGEADPYAYLVKPFEGRELHTTIQMALHRRQLELALRDANEQLEQRVRERTADLSASQQMLAGIVANLEGAVIYRLIFAPDGTPHCDYVSPNVADVLGVTADAFRADPNVALGHLSPDDAKEVHAARARSLATGGTAALTFRLLRPDGGERWVSVRSRLSHCLPDGSQVRDGVFIDITAIKSAEAASRESEERLSVTLRSIGDGVLTTDVGGLVTAMNPIAERITGWPQQEALGRPVTDVFRVVSEDTGAAMRSPVHEVMTTGRVHNGSAHSALVTHSGTHLAIATTASPIQDAHGHMVGVALVFRDESEMRERRRQIERKSAMLVALRRVQEAFIANPEGATAFEDLLATLIIATNSEYGLIGEVPRDDQGERFLRLRAASAAAGLTAAQHYFREHMAEPREFHNLESLLGAVVLDDKPVIANDVGRDPRSRGVCPGHPPLRSFMGVPVVVAGETIGMLGVANRAAGYSQAILDELQPLVATCGSLLVGSRNEQRRRSAEGALRKLNANLETEVARRAAAQADTERTFTSLATSSPVGIFRTDAAGECLSVNDRWTAITGVTDAEAKGFGWTRALHPDDCDRVLAEWAAVAGTGSEFKSEYRFRRLDGETTWVLGQAVPMRDGSGVITGYIGTITDVTEQKQTELALRMLSADRAVLEGDAFYRSVVRNLVSLLDCDGAFITRRLPGSETLLQMVAAVEDGEFSGPGPFDPTGHPCADSLGGRAHIVATGLRDRHPHNAELAAKAYDSYAAVPIFDHRGAAIGNVAVISRHALTHPALTESLLSIFAVAVSAEMSRERGARRFHDLVEFASDGIVMVDQKGTIALVNRQTEELFGWSRHELIGQSVEVLVPTALRSGHVADRMRFTGKASRRPMGPARAGLRARRRDGTEFPVDISLSPIETEDGTMVVAEIRDITDRLRLEQQARRSQRMEAIGSLAGGIAHDLNNALAPITMSLSMLRSQPQNSRLIDTMERSALRAAGMVRQLLSFAKGAEGNRAPVDTAHLVAEIEAIIRPTFPKNITIKVRTEPGRTAVLGDATQLHQVLLNLCVNARDAMPNGGTLTVTVGHTDIPESAQDAVARAGRYVVLHVADTGAGIPPETIDRIFDPFFTTKGPDQGTGLGLSIVASIAKGHGGFVLVSSAIGSGTTFSVHLPVAAESIETAPVVTSDSCPLMGTGETILLVDDEAMVREVGVQLLSRLGFKPLIASDGTEALSLVSRFGPTIKVVITDLHMPSMDGLAFVAALRHLLADVPVIVSSGHLGDTAQAFRGLRVSTILDKPFTQEKLARALQIALGQR